MVERRGRVPGATGPIELAGRRRSTCRARGSLRAPPVARVLGCARSITLEIM
jgi:hypothetical protein